MKILAPAAAALLLSGPFALAQNAVESATTPAATAASAAPKGPSAAALSWVQKHAADWPEESRQVAAQLITKYGPPAEHSQRRMAWYDNGPWKRTVLHRDGAQHNFAHTHRDILEQTVAYRVPLEKFAELAEFNGSLLPDRTRGELTSISDAEDTNFLALNVAHDLIRGDRTVDQARTYYAQIIRAKMIGEPDRALQGLKFTPASSASESADPDELAPLMRHMSESH